MGVLEPHPIGALPTTFHEALVSFISSWVPPGSPSCRNSQMRFEIVMEEALLDYTGEAGSAWGTLKILVGVRGLGSSPSLKVTFGF